MFIPETAQSSLALGCSTSAKALSALKVAADRGRKSAGKTKSIPELLPSLKIDSPVLHFLPKLHDSGDEDTHRQDTYPDLFY